MCHQYILSVLQILNVLVSFFLNTLFEEVTKQDFQGRAVAFERC